MYDNFMYLLLCTSVNIRVMYRERAWLLSQALSLYMERAWLLRSGMVFIQRKCMAFDVRHGLCTEKEHGLLVQAWSFYAIQSSTVMFSFFTVWVPTMIIVCRHCLCFYSSILLFLGDSCFKKIKRYAILLSPVCFKKH